MTEAAAPPFFSIVVPVFRVQEYLRECLDSVLAQDFTDFEIVAVDDCSPDSCGALLDAYAARDDRTRVVHLPENVGLGPARNTGLAKARGRYVLFLDGDDTLVAGALGALARRLAATGEPDILIFGHARTYPDGSAHQHPLAHLLDEEACPPSFSLAERPEILDLPQLACNKAYRSAFVKQHGLAFPVGYYEDAPWNFLALTAARSIAVFARICMHYRQRSKGGNILRTTTLRHCDVFEQYQRIFDRIDANPELSRWGPQMFRKMTDHYLAIAKHSDRLPADSVDSFLGRASRDFHRRSEGRSEDLGAIPPWSE